MRKNPVAKVRGWSPGWKRHKSSHDVPVFVEIVKGKLDHHRGDIPSTQEGAKKMIGVMQRMRTINEVFGGDPPK